MEASNQVLSVCNREEIAEEDLLCTLEAHRRREILPHQTCHNLATVDPSLLVPPKLSPSTTLTRLTETPHPVAINPIRSLRTAITHSLSLGEARGRSVKGWRCVASLSQLLLEVQISEGIEGSVSEITPHLPLKLHGNSAEISRNTHQAFYPQPNPIQTSSPHEISPAQLEGSPENTQSTFREMVHIRNPRPIGSSSQQLLLPPSPMKLEPEHIDTQSPPQPADFPLQPFQPRRSLHSLFPGWASSHTEEFVSKSDTCAPLLMDTCAPLLMAPPPTPQDTCAPLLLAPPPCLPHKTQSRNHPLPGAARES